MLFGLLGRKKLKDQEEDAEPVEALKKKTPNTRPRVKKETPKPWGKKERLWVAGVFVFTILSSGVLAMYAREWKLPGVPRIEPPQVQVFTPEKIVFVNEPELDPMTQEKIEELKNDFSKATSELSGVYGFYIVDLEDGFSYGINHTENFQAASLIKLPIMAAMYLEDESGKLDLDKQYILKDVDKIGGAGSLQGEPEGTAVTYGGLIELMGQLSDNTAFNIGVNKLGKDNIEAVIYDLGMTGTSYETNTTTPFDIGQFFVKLWEGRLLNTQNTKQFLNHLTDTAWEDHLPAGIPEDVRVAHKYGREVHVVNDAGVVYADKPFVLVIMSKGVVESEADSSFVELAKLLYEGHTSISSEGLN